MTIEQTKKAIRKLGMCPAFKDGEWRIRYPNAKPGDGYFTNDADDAYVSAVAMSAHLPPRSPVTLRY